MDLVAQIDRTFVEGVLAVLAAAVIFLGTVYLLLSAVFGLPMAYFIAATGFFGFMVILTALWAFGAPGTPAFLGPKGDLPSWVGVAQGTALRSSTFPVIEEYPGGAWEDPEEDPGLSAEVEPVEQAFGEFLAEQANRQLERAGVEGEVLPTDFAVDEVRFTTVDETQLAAARAASTQGGREVMVVGYMDPGNEGVPSFIALGVSIVGFAVHIPFLDRAERRRKEILTGGDQPPYLGPA
jgi:hypothetical protein